MITIFMYENNYDNPGDFTAMIRRVKNNEYEGVINSELVEWRTFAITFDNKENADFFKAFEG